jgi:hypothetical protein
MLRAPFLLAGPRTNQIYARCRTAVVCDDHAGHISVIVILPDASSYFRGRLPALQLQGFSACVAQFLRRAAFGTCGSGRC